MEVSRRKTSAKPLPTLAPLRFLLELVHNSLNSISEMLGIEVENKTIAQVSETQVRQ
jgi:hypothetical protein